MLLNSWLKSNKQKNTDTENSFCKQQQKAFFRNCNLYMYIVSTKSLELRSLKRQYSDQTPWWHVISFLSMPPAVVWYLSVCLCVHANRQNPFLIWIISTCLVSIIKHVICINTDHSYTARCYVTVHANITLLL